MAEREIFVRKRDGTLAALRLQEIQDRLYQLSSGLKVVASKVALSVCDSLTDEISTSLIDEISAEIAMEYYTTHTDYEQLAIRLLADNLHKTIPHSFSSCMESLYTCGRVSSKFILLVRYLPELDKVASRESDFNLSFFGLKTLINNKYLLRNENGIISELPCYMLLRVAVGIHVRATIYPSDVANTPLYPPPLDKSVLKDIISTYEELIHRRYTHATPTLFNAGTNNAQFASCFLLSLNDDSVEGIYSTLTECALISKHAGGIGLHVHNLRSTGSIIKSTGCKTDGLIPMLRVFNESSLLVKQAGKRPGSIAIYLSPDHADIEAFLDMRLNHGEERERCRDLFSGLWIPDRFMQAVSNDEKWYLFSPDDAPGLSDVFGAEYDKLYEQYVLQGKYRKQVMAQELWKKIVVSQIETGTPYMTYKDAANVHSNQSNIGIIKSSNLCTEIMEVSTPHETAVCNLASICVSQFAVNAYTGSIEECFDFDGLKRTTKTVVAALNRVIDNTLYPDEKTKISNLAHRPIGIGVQGWQTLLFKLKISFDSDVAMHLNKRLFANLYHSAWEESARLKDIYGSYSSFVGSPLSKGILHCDTWDDALEDGLDWEELRSKVRRGVANSLITTIMPTASTAQICGNTEACEPLTSNIYVRRTQAGEFEQVNQYLVQDLEKMNLWNVELRTAIIQNEGSIQNIAGIPNEIKARYKTAYEISQKVIIDQARGRAPYIDQSQSMNLFMYDPTIEKVSSMQFYAWRCGLKTGQYYLRSRPRVKAQQFTIAPPSCESCSA